MKIAIINGPNLNLLGSREPDIYGSQSFDSFFEELKKEFPAVTFNYFQSNVEGEIINQLQKVGFDYDGILLNAGGYTHTSVSIADAIASIKTPAIEIHISNPQAREQYRHISLIAGKCKGTISGFGLNSYRLGVIGLMEKNKSYLFPRLKP